MHLVGFIRRIYHDARPPERQAPGLISGTIMKGLAGTYCWYIYNTYE